MKNENDNAEEGTTTNRPSTTSGGGDSTGSGVICIFLLYSDGT
jgi:hypothetical protein